MNWLTSIFGPCMVVDPKQDILYDSSLLSTVGYLILLGCLQMLSYCAVDSYIWHKDITEDKNEELIKAYRIICWTIILVSAFFLLCSLKKKDN